MNNIRGVRAAAVEFAIALATTIGTALAIRLVAGSWDLAFAQGLVIGIVSLIRRINVRRRGIGAPGTLQQPAGSAAARPRTHRWGAPWLPARISVSTGTLLAMMVLLYLTASAVSALAVGFAFALLAPQSEFWTVCGLTAAVVAVIAGLRVRKLLSVSLLLVHKAFPIERPQPPS